MSSRQYFSSILDEIKLTNNTSMYHWDRYMSRRFHDHKQKDDMINRVRKFGIATSQRRLPTMINGQVTKHYLHIERRK